MRLDKFLTECGIGSRSEVKVLLRKGEIFVNNSVIKSPKQQIDLNKDNVVFNNKVLEYREDRYYILNKPSGLITATKDSREKTVLDFLPDWVIRKNLFPVGRLDKDTEGLLLLTTDGKLAHDLLSPKKHVDKTYLVHLKFNISHENIKKLEKGVVILDNYLTKPAKVKQIAEDKIHLTIREGKFHQVKEMAKAINNEVTYLKRISFGKLKLASLKKGEVIEISKNDIIL